MNVLFKQGAQGFNWVVDTSRLNTLHIFIETRSITSQPFVHLRYSSQITVTVSGKGIWYLYVSNHLRTLFNVRNCVQPYLFTKK